MSTEQRDSIPAPPAEKLKAQVAECEKCGRAAVVLCGNCIAPGEGQSPQVKRYTADEVEDMILRWCGFPERTIENVRHAFAMEATGGIDTANQEKPT